MKIKQIAGICAMVCLVIGILLGCNSADREDGSSQKNDPAQTMPKQSEGDTDVGAEEGSAFYDIPNGWIIAENMSTEGKKFYVEDGHEADRQPDNFSVEYRTNHYTAAEHELFRVAIMKQLSGQAEAYGYTVEASGQNTDNGDIVYIFTINGKDMVATQYYIVGEQKYCLIFATDFTGNSIAANAARVAANSFRWE